MTFPLIGLDRETLSTSVRGRYMPYLIVKVDFAASPQSSFQGQGGYTSQSCHNVSALLVGSIPQ